MATKIASERDPSERLSNNFNLVSPIDPLVGTIGEEVEEEVIDFLLLFLVVNVKLSCFAFIFVITTRRARDMSGIYLFYRSSKQVKKTSELKRNNRCVTVAANKERRQVN